MLTCRELFEGVMECAPIGFRISEVERDVFHPREHRQLARDVLRLDQRDDELAVGVGVADLLVQYAELAGELGTTV